MSESIFRSSAPAPAPVATPEAPTGGDPHVGTTTEDNLFYTYEGEHMRPFTADYFEVPTMWDQDTGLARDLREIEGYVREQVHNGKVENTTKAAREFIKELERKAEITRYESTPTRIQKLIGYLDFRRTVDG